MGNSFGDSIKKIGNLQDELRDSYKLIIEGFRYIEKNNNENNFYFLMFQCLSQGFERFMKSYICLAHKNKKGHYPSSSELKSIGHNLLGLLKVITKEYFNKEKEICNDDYLFLMNNDDFRTLLKILDDFAKKGRYHNLDGVVDSNIEKFSPESKWQEFEDKYFKEIGLDRVFLYPREYKERDDQLASYVKSVLERFMASVARQIQFKYLGQEATSIAVWDYSFFAGLREGDYGKTDYSKVKIENKTLINQPRINDVSDSENVKTKLLYRKDFDVWPFFVDTVLVKKKTINSYQYCTVVLEGLEYSLNGIATSKFKIPTSHEAEQAELGVSTSEFLQIALNL